MTKNKFLTYDDKYINGGKKMKGGYKVPTGRNCKGMETADRKIPADMDDKLKEEIETLAVQAFKAIGSSGVCRIDFLIDDKKKKVYVNELNSIPGSLSFYLWEPTGVKYNELLDEVINIGIKDYKKRTSKTHSFSSNILRGFSMNGGIKGMKGIKGKLR